MKTVYVNSYFITKDLRAHLKHKLWIYKSMHLHPDVHMQHSRNGDKPRKWHSLNAVTDNNTQDVWYKREIGPVKISGLTNN